MTDLETAIEDLRRLRQTVAATAERTLARLDAAIAALTDQSIESSDAPRSNGATTESSKVKVVDGVMVMRRHRSVKAMAQSLLEESDWALTYDQILSEYVTRGEPIEAADPKSALRTAIWTLTNEHKVIKMADGSFKAARWEWQPAVQGEAPL